MYVQRQNGTDKALGHVKGTITIRPFQEQQNIAENT